MYIIASWRLEVVGFVALHFFSSASFVFFPLIAQEVGKGRYIWRNQAANATRCLVQCSYCMYKGIINFPLIRSRPTFCMHTKCWILDMWDTSSLHMLEITYTQKDSRRHHRCAFSFTSSLRIDLKKTTLVILETKKSFLWILCRIWKKFWGLSRRIPSRINQLGCLDLVWFIY